MRKYILLFLILFLFSQQSYSDESDQAKEQVADDPETYNSQFLNLSLTSVSISESDRIPDEFQQSSSFQFYGRSNTAKFFSTPLTFELEGHVEHYFNNSRVNSPYSLYANLYFFELYDENSLCLSKDSGNKDLTVYKELCNKYSPLNPPLWNVALNLSHSEFKHNHTTPLNSYDNREIRVTSFVRYHKWFKGFNHSVLDISDSREYGNYQVDLGFSLSDNSISLYDSKSVFVHFMYRRSISGSLPMILNGEFEFNTYYEYTDFDNMKNGDELITEVVLRNKISDRKWFLELSLAHINNDRDQDTDSFNTLTLSGVYYFSKGKRNINKMINSRFFVNGRIRRY